MDMGLGWESQGASKWEKEGLHCAKIVIKFYRKWLTGD